MIDIKEVAKNPKLFKDSCKKRGLDPQLIDELLKIQSQRNSLITALEENLATINKTSSEIGLLAKDKKFNDINPLKEKVKKLKEDNERLKDELNKVEENKNSILLNMPNLLDPQTPAGEGEEDNQEVLKKGIIPTFNFPIKDHVQLGQDLNMLDFDKASQVVGSRFVFYKKDLAQLERALINFFLDELNSSGYQEIIPPFICHERSLEGTGQLPKFKKDLFKIEDSPWYLIPTSEVPLTNLKREEIFSNTELPLKYCASTPCFRSEAGAAGKDTKGLIRLHQFNKVEMVQIVSPEKSSEAHEEMVSMSESLLTKLGLPFRKLLLCSKDIGFSANKCYDLEVWVPSQNKYREISSISNCGDFQARRAGIKLKKEGEKAQFAHTLNGSALAVGRTVVAIMENFQQKDGSILIPQVLQKYMNGQKIIK